MGRGHPQGGGIFGAYLAAQETSPTLTLANAGLSDEGALEIAHFLAGSRHLVRLDLTGNNLSSTGVHHIAKALKQNRTLESLTLKHNRIGDLGDLGLETLCQALHGNQTLRHLDLRHAGLQGASAAKVIGEMLRANTHLSHLELSWNPLDLTGGQELLENLQANTTLFDCQLTGCGISDETLLSIAQILHRNRKVKGAALSAGPFQACAEWAGDGQGPRAPGAVSAGVGGPLAESQFIACTRGHETCAFAGGPDDGSNEDLILRSTRSKASSSSCVVSSEATNAVMMRLAKYMQDPNVKATDAAHAQEMYDYLDKAQKQLIRDRAGVEAIHTHLKALSDGFRDRELRSRDTIGAGQAELMDVNKDILGIRGIFERRSQDLALMREQNDQMQRDHHDDEQQAMQEEAEQMNRLAELKADKKELEKRLASLEESQQKQDALNAGMRKGARRLHQGVTLLHHSG